MDTEESYIHDAPNPMHPKFPTNAEKTLVRLQGLSKWVRDAAVSLRAYIWTEQAENQNRPLIWNVNDNDTRQRLAWHGEGWLSKERWYLWQRALTQYAEHSAGVQYKSKARALLQQMKTITEGGTLEHPDQWAHYMYLADVSNPLEAEIKRITALKEAAS